jgi:pyroglutamyl-peptidase
MACAAAAAAAAADSTPPLDESTTTTTTTTMDDNNNNNNNNNNNPQVSFIITGFGPFGGIEENPSTILVTELVAYLGTCGKHDLAAQIVHAKVMETSVEDVRATLDGFFEESSSNSNNNTPNKSHVIIIYLHIGVNYKGTCMQLEQCAYNEATFRIPDQRGFQPQSGLVVETKELGATYTTTLDLESICQAQTQMQIQPTVLVPTVTTTTPANTNALPSTLEIQVSTDPGRFVCNYTYCYSLDKLQNHPQEQHPHHVRHSLFLHVPTFQVVPQTQQLAYVADLLQRLADQVKVEVLEYP